MVPKLEIQVGGAFQSNPGQSLRRKLDGIERAVAAQSLGRPLAGKRAQHHRQSDSARGQWSSTQLRSTRPPSRKDSEVGSKCNSSRSGSL